MEEKIKIKCTCGKEFETYNHFLESPYDYMCSECSKKDAWRFAMRMLQLNNKIICIKCGWKLREKDCKNIWEKGIEFKCKCCGYRFEIRVPDPDVYYP